MSDIVPVRSTITANGGKVIVSTGGQPVVGIELEGTWSGGTLHIQETVSGDGFVDAQVTNAANTPVSAVITGNGKFFVAAAGRSAIQVIATAWGSGTATVVGVPTQGGAGGSSGGGGGAITAAVGAIADGADLTLGATTDAAATTDNGTFTFISLFKRLLQKLTAQFPAALTGSGNLKVAVTESTASQAVTAASLPLPTGAAADATVAGVTTAVGTLTTQSDFDTKVGSLTETAPATDVASSGLNGRLQRVAQRLTSLIALLPTALGSTTAANSLGVTLSTDGQFVTSTGSLTEAAPATDTASSGLNGRLQRVAQRLSSLIALLPTALISNRLDVNLGAAPATVTVQGAGASGAALAGNPVRGGISDGTNGQDWRQMVFTTGNAATGYPGVALLASNGTTLDPVKNDGGGANASLRVNIASGGSTCAVGALADANAQAGLKVYAAQMGFNGTNNDNWRNNVDATLLASAARTTTQTGSNITAYNCQAIAVTLDVTATVSTCSLTVTIGYVDPASGKVVNLLTSAVIAATGTTMFLVDPRVPAVANLIAQKPIGRNFVITVTVGNANSQTYSVGYTLIPC